MTKTTRDSKRWFLLTGLSGAGKTTALKILEDQGYFAIDNLPIPLLAPFLTFLKSSKKKLSKVVLGMDARGKEFLNSYQMVLAQLEESKIRFEILFFDCSDKVLIQRFSTSRRPHPLKKKGMTLAETIADERDALTPLKELASKTFDTSKLNIHQLKRILNRFLSKAEALQPLHLTFLSFGFKYGPPVEADMILDVRFLTNPFFVPHLKEKKGTAKPVLDFVNQQVDAQRFLKKIKDLLTFLIPRFQKEGKSHLTIALGCTGGRHRSVAMIEILESKFKSKKWEINKVHRDLDRTGQ